MNASLTKVSIPLLRWTLGLVVAFESCQFVFSSAAAHFLAKAGLPSWIRPVLGGAEIVAAVLFLVPLTSRIGSYLLLVIFALAALVHVLHGQFEVGGLVVYAAAVFVSMQHAENKKVEAGLERN
ncbi:MAG TPA: DoxX family protein [Candidatus Acidoferrum sp.]|nr:DoxX family protein [Candidatus Acidoferrum sp.]